MCIRDRTLDIVKEFGARVVMYEGTLLGARKVGAENSKGKYVLLVDSDQVLQRETIKKAVEKCEEGKDMLWLYERSYMPRRLMEKWYDADRVLVQKYAEDFIEPVGGTILPRFYRKDVLIKAFKNMPEKILPLCVAHDHAIIYYEAKKVSDKVGSVGSLNNPAVWHMEPWSWGNLFKKTYRYGITTRKLVENGVYPELLKSKNKGRKKRIP